jgi:hypothetical protein
MFEENERKTIVFVEFGFFGIFGENERKTIVWREAVLRRHRVVPPLIVLVDQYPAIEVQKATITSTIWEKS